MSYQDGFEDATELCLREVCEAKSRTEARRRVKYLLDLVKEDKFDRIKQMLGVIPTLTH